MSVRESMIRRMIDAFNKKQTSNNGKLILILSEKIDELNALFTKIENWRDINQAEGATLDAIGRNVGQVRGQVNDDIMRFLIRARIARNSSDGTINRMIEALALSLNVSPKTIKIKALYSEGEPAALMIEDLPVETLNRAGMTVNQFGYIAQEVAAAGVRVASIDLTGTFAFSSQLNALETSIEYGFAPLDQSTGGTLGAVFEPENEILLPF